MVDLKPELIEDIRLTPTMSRIRSSRRQVFKEKGSDVEVTLEHPTNREMYAELIDGKWYWVTGCGECKGEPRDWMTYIECDKHNVCRECFIKSKDLADGVLRWGGKKGWLCGTCKDAKDLEIRREAFEKFNSQEYNEYDFQFTDEPMCPHCGTKIDSDGLNESQVINCYVCDGAVAVEVEYTRTYSTSIKGKRIKE